MPERPRAKVNLVAEQLLEKLALIGKPEKAKWLTEPVTVQMMTGPGDLKKPRPGIFLEVVEVEQETKRTIMSHGDRASFLIHCTVEDILDPSGACHDLMADVARTIRENPKLDEPSRVLESGYVQDGRRKAMIETVEGKSGFALGFVEVTAYYLTSDEAP